MVQLYTIAKDHEDEMCKYHTLSSCIHKGLGKCMKKIEHIPTKKKYATLLEGTWCTLPFMAT